MTLSTDQPTAPQDVPPVSDAVRALLQQIAQRDKRLAELAAELENRSAELADFKLRCAAAHDPGLLRNAAPPLASLQVFWSSAGRPGDYTAAAMASAVVPQDGAVRTIAVELPPDAFGPLRLDVGDTPASWFFSRLVLYELSDQHTLITPSLAECSSGSGFAALRARTGVAIHIESATAAALPRGCHLLAWDSDPQIEWMIPQPPARRSLILLADVATLSIGVPSDNRQLLEITRRLDAAEAAAAAETERSRIRNASPLRRIAWLPRLIARTLAGR